MTGVEVGDTATFTCDSGYGIVGDDSLICGSDGAWSNDAPLCRREYHVIHDIDFNMHAYSVYTCIVQLQSSFLYHSVGSVYDIIFVLECIIRVFWYVHITLLDYCVVGIGRKLLFMIQLRYLVSYIMCRYSLIFSSLSCAG